MPATSLTAPIADLPPLLRVPTLVEAKRHAPFDAAIKPPGSKSLTNRALLLAALADGVSTLRGILSDADDAVQMRRALSTLGATVDHEDGDLLALRGVGGRWRVPADGVTLDLNNAGTAARFLAGAALLSPAPITIDGNSRMRERPIGELAEVLTTLGCTAEFLGTKGCPPLRITPPGAGVVIPKVVDIATTQSSQFVSALLLVGPWLKGGITIRLSGPITSASYISMTLGLLTRLGAGVRTSDDLHVIRVGPPPPLADDAPQLHGLPAFDYSVEPDASGATYFWTAAAINPGSRCRILGLDESSLQGDSRFPDLLTRMGVRTGRATRPYAFIQTVGPKSLRPILADMSDMPDAAMSLAAAACFAPGTSILRGLRTLRVKECDRIAAMHDQLARIGVTVQTPVQGDHDAMTITPPPGGIDCSANAPRVEFETYDDHRIAMSLALIALRRPHTFIKNPKCVAKTYPTFWSDFAKLYRDT